MHEQNLPSVVTQTSEPAPERALPFPAGSRVRVKSVPDKLGTVIGWFDEVARERWKFIDEKPSNAIAVRFDYDIEKCIGLRDFELEAIS